MTFRSVQVLVLGMFLIVAGCDTNPGGPGVAPGSSTEATPPPAPGPGKGKRGVREFDSTRKDAPAVKGLVD